MARLARLGATAAAASLLAASIGTAIASAESAYVSERGPMTVGQFALGPGGLLTPLVPPTIGSSGRSFEIAITPDGTSVYVTLAESKLIAQYSVGAGGVLVAKSPATVATAERPSGIAVSPDGKSVYVASGTGPVSQYDVGAGGVLTPKSPPTVTAGSSPAGVAVSPDGKSVYVSNYQSESISQFDVGSGGTLTPKSPATVAAGNSPDHIAITPDGANVYVGDVNGFELSQYTVGAGGTLTPKSPAIVPSGHFPEGMAVSPDAKTLYVANESGSTIERYAVGASGLLSLVSETPTATEGPKGLAMSPDGTSLYTAVYYGNVVSQYNVAPGGALSPKSPATVATGEHPESIALIPDQGPIAAFTSTPAPAGSPSLFNATASFAPGGTVARYDWSFGDGTSAPNGGPTPSHAYVAPGSYTVTLQATDNAGCSVGELFTGESAYCNASPGAVTSLVVNVPPGPPPIARPVITGVRQSASRWREGSKLAKFSRKRHGKKLPVGTTISFSLNESAAVKFNFTQRVKGRKVRGKCVVASRRRGRACKRTVSRGTLTFTGHSGSNRVIFQGLISRSHKLKPGRYALVITATNSAGQTSTPYQLNFTIVK